MKTTIDIPNIDLKEVLHYTGARTKKAAILQAVEDFNRRQRMMRLTKKFGTLKNFISAKELKQLRTAS